MDIYDVYINHCIERLISEWTNGETLRETHPPEPLNKVPGRKFLLLLGIATAGHQVDVFRPDPSGLVNELVAEEKDQEEREWQVGRDEGGGLWLGKRERRGPSTT